MSLLTEESRRVHAARLGVVIFLASEGLLFAGLFALYAAYRVRFPAAFAAGVRLDLRWLGSLNTGILLASSACMAGAVAVLARGALTPPAGTGRQAAPRSRAAQALMLVTVALGITFLILKGCEYADHIHTGIVPGGHSAWFAAHPDPGLKIFVALYFLMTALHAVHMVVGIVWVSVLIPGARTDTRSADRIELGALYWHFVDLLWVFLWPLFYLMRI